jgi:hypothetical protein
MQNSEKEKGKAGKRGAAPRLFAGTVDDPLITT